MTDQELLARITCDPRVMVGKPVIKGTRLTVDFILNLMAHSSTVDEIVEEYDGLVPDDILACLLFASKSLSNTAADERAVSKMKASHSYISYQRVCCYFSVIPATNGSGFSEPSGSSQLVAAQPPYANATWIETDRSSQTRRCSRLRPLRRSQT